MPGPAGTCRAPTDRWPPGAAVQTANGALSRAEQTKRSAIVPVSREPGGDQVTPTVKLKRQAIAGPIRPTSSGPCTPEPARRRTPAELTPVAMPVPKSPGRTARRRQPPILSQPAGMTGTAQNPTLCVRPAARKA